ncbi:MAG TPA: PBP1A family penicillin-binding protein [Gemmatimonadaceae bacterium]|jgi:penicillin-binding protein 1A|nr:PBP1A family penicillin-binding protein [Gemmatimonadaceae bacterium]
MQRPSRLRRFTESNPRLVRGVLFAATFFIAFGGGLAYGGWALVCREGRCPPVQILDSYTPRQTSKVYAADGRFVAEVGLERRTLVKLGEIPKLVQDAFVLVEDKRFYSHSGIDWIRVPGAALRNLRAGSTQQGFSTITMQLARNVFPERISRERRGLEGLIRKLKEVKVARAIEARYSKDKILELYLNQINLGNGAYGVETASQRYFGKSVQDLNLAEAAMLAALPKAPARYNPRRFADRAVQRRNLVVDVMRRNGAITDAEASLARAYPLRLASKTESGEVAPYFVEWVRQQLDEKFGARLYEQGLRVYTTLDLDLQSAAERALENQIRAIEGGKYGRFPHRTYEQLTARAANGEESAAANSPYLQGAFIAIDPRDGAVRALVGGREFDDSKFNRATQALRQPGSTFKPIVYSAALQNGRSPATVIDDAPVTLPQLGGEAWSPQNYDGKFEGPITLRRALYMSRNLPAIRTGMELGEQTVIDMAKRFGLSTTIPPYPSIHIGAADVYPIEMIASYTTFANLGVRTEPNAIRRVENQRGEVIWEPQPVRTQVLSSPEAWLMVNMMKDVVIRGTAAGSVGSRFRVPSAGKTGTTNDGADVWFIGYTADLVAGVWMGFDKPQKIKSNAQGGQLAGPAYAAFMTEVYRRKPAPPDWPRPEGITTREIDRTTGQLANPYCPSDVVEIEYFIIGTEPIQECTVHSPFNMTQPFDTTVRPGSTSTRVPLPPGKAPRDTANPFKIP